MAGLPLAAIDHLGVRVADLESALGFYQGLGMQLLSRDEDAGFRMAVLRAGEAELHLFQAKDGREAPRHDHVSFRVPSLAEATAELERRGIAYSGPHGYQGTRFVKFRDPDGTVWELLEVVG